MLPDQFIWIAVGRIGRKVKQPQSGAQALDKALGLLGNVGGAPINDQEDWSLGDARCMPFRRKDRGARGEPNQYCYSDLPHIDFLLALGSCGLRFRPDELSLA